ncbi:twin-arginine translocation pathway signal [Xanthobacter dioxanivorans]|uniref:Twin-arginine translocation pathway signal n=1 Tax=Xanthobacter dioxanivorans TaxID=2528964 RepID=A0A974SL27_9HYPH|nr:twin-arginine translocation pathway signal [Xanthobacter dioxanivorans]QRG08123.1 twin-arginine translocation pathway signal [Xanthobacter dioxanivorans]
MTEPAFTRRRLLAGSALAIAGSLAGSLVLAGAPAPALAQNATIIIGKDGWLFPGWESLSVLDRAGITANVGLLQETKTALAARGIALVTAVVPLKANFYKERLPDGTAVSADVSGQYDFILGELKKAGIDTVDLRPALKSVQTGRQTSFYRADYHWTAWASEAAAEAVAQAIKARIPKLAGGAGGDKLGEWVTQRHLGDLAERFLTPDQQKQIGPDLYTVRTPPAAKSSLLDSGAAPVHIVGNSFVQPYLGFPQKLSNALDRPVSLTWNPGNVGPWATFLQYVGSPDFAKAPPQVIVWQFNEGPFHSGPQSTDQWDAPSIMSPQAWRDRMLAAVRR